ncbi:SSI family serine proteinase inhibitor [Streptomyces sp. TR06-5]|uniref:SSI family serine proteinase inhibitor n=1 Tax=Streptomyces sp. TR06-5 TaxID=3385976 RepID=UPI0039A17A58
MPAPRPRRTAVRAAAALAALAAVHTPAAPAQAAVPPVRDHLTVTVHDSGRPVHDGRFDLFCHPTAGNHPRPEAACRRLDALTSWGRPDPFAPVPPGRMCTTVYGGPATAHVTGTWGGRPVNADFSRSDGCRTQRWNDLVPLLPRTRL